MTAAWRVAESIALELDAALYIALGHAQDGLAVDELPPPAAALRAAASESWRTAWTEHLGPWGGWGFQLGRLALLTGQLIGTDYSQVTLAMRGLTPESALERARALTADMHLGASADGSWALTLPALLRAAEGSAMGTIGLSAYGSLVAGRRLERELEQLVRLLGDTEWRATFWHLLDRFYFEAYGPWRAGRADTLAELVARAEANLGGLSGDAPPELSWLPAQNALVALPELGGAVSAGRQAVLFWAEPLGLFDVLLVVPGLLIVSFAEPGTLFEHFDAQAVALADRVKALADPTRLKMLRLIRHFDLDNTQIAGYLELARPTVSIHARQLREAGLIDSRQDGRQARHALQPSALAQLFADLVAFLGVTAAAETSADGDGTDPPAT